MSGWLELTAALAAFVGAHALPARPAPRRLLVGLLGRPLYLVGYSAASILLLAWAIGAAGRAPYLPIWQPEPWQAGVAVAAMAAACALLALAVGRPNPFSLGGAGSLGGGAGSPGSTGGYDPERPGILGLTRHPILLAAALWAGAHLLANGDLAHILLFGTCLLMALGGMAALDRRRRRQLGPAWARLAPRRPGWTAGDGLRLLAGGLLLAFLLWAHPVLIGVDPLARF